MIISSAVDAQLLTFSFSKKLRMFQAFEILKDIMLAIFSYAILFFTENLKFFELIAI